jgi:hypothetical protein
VPTTLSPATDQTGRAERIQVPLLVQPARLKPALLDPERLRQLGIVAAHILG